MSQQPPQQSRPEASQAAPAQMSSGYATLEQRLKYISECKYKY